MTNRALRWLAAAACIAIAPATLAAQGAAPDSVPAAVNEPMLMEVRVGRLAARTVAAVRHDDTALLPLGDVLRLFEIRIRPESATRWHFTAPGQPDDVVIDFARHELKVGNHRQHLADSTMLVLNGEPMLNSAFLALLLHIGLLVDWEELSVNVADPATLPIADRLRRDAMRHAALDRPIDEPAPLADVTGALSNAGGLVIDYGVQSSLGSADAAAPSWSIGVGSELFHGGVTVTVDHSTSAGRVDASWLRAWSGASGVAQLELGDGLTTGLHPRAAQGFSLSNAPLTRLDDYGALPVGGLLATGWDIEAWRGGRMVAYDSVDASGRFRLDVPAQYGENALELVAYGPDGEVRRYSRDWNLSSDAVAPGRFVYGLAAGACRTVECTATANADLRYGVAQGWTARVGIDQFWRNDLGALTHPYAELFGTLTTGIGVGLTAVANAVLQAELAWSPSTSLRADITAAHFDTTVVAPILTEAGRANQITATMAWQRRGASIDLAVDRFTTGAGANTSGRLEASTAFGGVQWLASIASAPGDSLHGTFWNGLTTGLDAILVAAPARTTLRLGVDASAGSIARLRGAVGIPIASIVRIDIGANRTLATHANQLTVMVVGDLPYLRSTTSATSQGASSLSQGIQGSLVLDPARGTLTPRALPGLARGGVTGRACLDTNGDGRCSADEPGVAGLRITAAGMVVTTGPDGRWTIWDLPPYTPVIIALDSASLAAPYLVPPFRQALITPPANRLITLDLPIAPGGVVEGTVQLESGEPAAGLLLRLRRNGSDDRATLRVFSDGGFYAAGLRPGQWQLLPDAADAAGLGAVPTPLNFEVPVARDGAIVDGLKLVLQRAAALDSDAARRRATPIPQPPTGT